MAKTIVVAKDPYRWNASTWKTKAQWRRWEHVGMRPDMTLEDLTLDWADENVVDLEIQKAVESIQFSRTIEGASTLIITVRDPLGHIFSIKAGRARKRIDSPKKSLKQPVPVDEGWQEINMTDLIERAVDVVMDDVHFRLVKVRYSYGLSQIELTFEDRIIYWLRRKKGPIRSSRAQVTRAEFLLRLLREIKQEKIPFICPELHKTQPLAKEKQTGVSDVDPGGGGGFTKRQKFTVKGATATQEQKRNMNAALDAASAIHGAKKKALKALISAVIVESLVKNLKGGDRDSRGILQVRDGTAKGMHIDNMNIEECVRAFMSRGFWGKGGAILVAKSNPGQSAGWVAQQVQGSGVPDAYDKVSDEADHWLEGYSGDTGVTGGGGSYIKSFQYARDKDEDSWTCMTRLAEEVNWRLFPVGRTMYFMSEDDLFRRRIRHRINPGSAEFVDLNCDIDWGKPVNEATIIVNLGLWDAPPGCVIELEGFGPPDGRWLVASCDRDYFSPIAELTLHQPGEPKREPAHERVTRSESAREGGGPGLSHGKSADFYVEAKRISDATPGYGHEGHGSPLSKVTSSMHLDCSSSTSLALYRAEMWESSRTTARVSGGFDDWGDPGRGERITVWYNIGHVFSQFESGAGMGHKRFDTGGPGGGSGPKIRDSWRPTTGFTARHWPGT